MSQQENVFAKFVPDPSKVPDPNRIGLQQLQKYQSIETERLGALGRSLRRSAVYVGGVFGLCLLGAWLGERSTRSELFGADNKGGSYLDLLTYRDEDHYAYNREFQRMFHLAETQERDAPVHSAQLLTDLGIAPSAHGAPGVSKRSAHEKYF